MIQSLQCRGFLSMIGAFMITMGIGLMYLWGIISIYATSYYRIVANDPNFTEYKADIVFPLQLLGQVLYTCIIGYIYPYCRQNVQKVQSSICLHYLWGCPICYSLHVIVQWSVFYFCGYVRINGWHYTRIHLCLPYCTLLYVLS